MNFSKLLIILYFTVSVFSNRTEDYDVCTLSYYRPKRAHAEYTRWHANPDTTEEFIVKVFDDDISTPKIKPVAAVNIQPFTKAQDRIIIAGALLDTTNTEPALDPYKDYTRFMPPTVPSATRLDKNIIIAPVREMPPIRPKGIDIKFDELPRHVMSPPASPQFIGRSTTLVARQYAPVAPVSFTRRNTIGPLTPRTVDKFMLHKTSFRPTRTQHPEMIIPARTSNAVNFIPKYNSIFPHEFAPARKKSLSLDDLHRTSIIDSSDHEITSKAFSFTYETGGYRKSYIENIHPHEKVNKEQVSSYNEYGDDDKDESGTKQSLDSKESNFDEKDESATAEKNNDLDESENVNNTEAYVNYEDEEENNKTYSSTIDLQKVVSTETSIDHSKDEPKKRKHQTCSVLKINPLTFSSPQTLHEIVTQLKKWAEESPVAKWLDITNGNLTVMENPIYMMIVDDPTSGQIVSAKQTVMIVAGIQGRDHHAVTAAMYLLYQLIERSEAHSDLLTKYRFWIIPVFNPDGYHYSMIFPHRREWSKNLRQLWDSCKGRVSCQDCERLGIRCTIQPCYGINLDRNFEYQWIPPDELRAEHPCGSLYAGPRQLSEAETRALTHFLHDQRSPIYTFIAFKEGDVLGILYPYSHTKKRRAFDHVYRQRASRAAQAAYSISGRPYVAGQTSEFLPLYAGGIEDWVDGHLGIDNTYTVMMFRPTDAQNSKLVTERVVHEAYAAVDTLLLQSVEPLGAPQVSFTNSEPSPRNISNKIIIVFLSIIIFGYG